MKYNLHPEDFPFSGRELNALSEKAPQKHKDPFDKILICQAKVEDMLFLTHDHLILYYNESCVVSV